MKFRFIKLPTYNRFDYTPRYYDPEQEGRDVRRAVSESEARESKEAYRKRLAEGFNRNRREQKQSIIIRLVVVLILTLALVYGYLWVLEWAAKLK
jgi:hypothetical protein